MEIGLTHIDFTLTVFIPQGIILLWHKTTTI